MMKVVPWDMDNPLQDKFAPGAFVGSILLTSGVVDTVNIFHGVSGCYNLAEHLRTDHVPLGGFGRLIPTGYREAETVRGGVRKLDLALRKVVNLELVKEKPACIWVSWSDCPAIAGDDMVGTARRFERESDIKIIPIDNCGFRGGIVRGAELALCRILDEVVEPYDGPKKGLNIIAPFLIGSNNWPLDVDYMVELLEAADIPVNLVLSRNIHYEDLKRMARAEANYVLSYEDMPDFVRKSEEKEIPVFQEPLVLPYGVGNSEEWYLAMAERFGNVDKAKRRLEAEMADVQGMLKGNYNFSWMTSFLSDKYVAVCGQAPFAAAITRYLFHDLNIRVKVVGLWGETEQAFEKAEEVLRPLEDYMDFTVIENPTYFQIGNAVKEANVDFVVGSIQDKPLFKGLGIPHLNLAGFYFFNNYNFIPWPLCGVKGTLRLFTETCRVVEDAFYETEAWKDLAFTPRDGA